MLFATLNLNPNYIELVLYIISMLVRGSDFTPSCHPLPLSCPTKRHLNPQNIFIFINNIFCQNDYVSTVDWNMRSRIVSNTPLLTYGRDHHRIRSNIIDVTQTSINIHSRQANKHHQVALINLCVSD